ncbi:hypothetical protein MTR67_001509 [Solanum verrucosum]|uniref:Uncharacterized protein n=1 Tax=Solanum verrucosum TaxID=315347 RepID=A0AAF0T7X8_SOLVR|nr:hypothetical protein MTR67_001509 [Solanum verrucosum]
MGRCTIDAPEGHGQRTLDAPEGLGQRIPDAPEGLGCCSMPSPKGKNQVGERKKRSVDRRVVPQCSVESPKVIDLENAKGQVRNEMEITKRRIAEWLGK